MSNYLVTRFGAIKEMYSSAGFRVSGRAVGKRESGGGGERENVRDPKEPCKSMTHILCPVKSE